MLNRIAKFLIIAGVLFFTAKWLIFWLFETSDSYFYWAFADFIRTGKYFAPHPYYWTIPTTFTPPLYSFFLFLGRLISPVRTDIFIHFFQILALLLSGYFLYKTLVGFIRKEIAKIICVIYLFIPANFFISSGLMPETFALLGLSVYIYLAFKILTERKKYLLKYLVLFGSVITLIRYNFICLFIISLIWIITENIQRRKKSKYFRTIFIPELTFIFLSILILISWIIINYQLTNSWGLSDQMGKNLYNRVLGGDKLTPTENNLNWQTLKKITDNKLDLFQPTYQLEPQILSYFGGSVAKESQFFANIAVAAIQNHPLDYLKNTFLNFFKIHGNGLPYSTNLYTYGWLAEKCRTLDTISFCKPIFTANIAAPLWNLLVQLSEYYYSTIPGLLNFFLFFPALLFALIQKNSFIKFSAIIYLISVITVIIPEVPVYRYLYPLYPIKFILFTYLLNYLLGRNHKINF